MDIQQEYMMNILSQGGKKKAHPFAMATVTQADPLRIQLDGDAPPLPYTPARLISSWVPEVGQRVKVSVVNGHYCVDGAVGEIAEQSGSNANGSWLRLPDGTQIARNTMTLNVRTYNDRVHGNWTFPQQFINTAYQFFVTLPIWNSVSFTSIQRNKISGVGGFGDDGRNTISERPTAFFTENITAEDREIRDVHVMAIGSWK